MPGELRGLEYMHGHYGRLSWKRLVDPSIKLARAGFVVPYDLAKHLSGRPFLVNDPSWAIDFAPNGTLLKAGDIMTRKRYAETLEEISNNGPGAFYRGRLARTTVAALRSRNGTMTVKGLMNYTVVTRKPLQVDYRGYRITAGSAPSSGSVALSTLKTVEGYSDFMHEEAINLSTHRLDEAFRFAYGEVSKV